MQASAPLLDAAIDADPVISGLRAESEGAMAALAEAVARMKGATGAYQDAVDVIAAEIELPAYEPPEPNIDPDAQPAGLVNDEMSLVEHVDILRKRKAYED